MIEQQQRTSKETDFSLQNEAIMTSRKFLLVMCVRRGETTFLQAVERVLQL